MVKSGDFMFSMMLAILNPVLVNSILSRLKQEVVCN